MERVVPHLRGAIGQSSPLIAGLDQASLKLCQFMRQIAFATGGSSVSTNYELLFITFWAVFEVSRKVLQEFLLHDFPTHLSNKTKSCEHDAIFAELSSCIENSGQDLISSITYCLTSYDISEIHLLTGANLGGRLG